MSVQKYCKNCGHPLSEDSRADFCGNCGESIYRKLTIKERISNLTKGVISSIIWLIILIIILLMGVAGLIQWLGS